MNTVFSTAVDLLENKISFVYATIVSQDGSTPRSVGTKMLVLSDEIIATIGGGAMENDVINKSRDIVLKERKPLFIKYDLSPNSAAVSDFICGGACEILLAYIDADKLSNLDVFKAAFSAEQNEKKAWLFYIIDSNTNASNPFQFCIDTDGKEIVGDIEEIRKNILEKRKNLISMSIHSESEDGIRYIIDQVNPGGIIYIFGGGHVAQEVAKLAVNTGFRVIVIDDRKEYANSIRFPSCETIVIENFDNLPDFQIDGKTYILIITRGHVHDYTVLSWALGKEPQYLGMIGSRVKRDTIYNRLMFEGFDLERLRKVKCPIGLDIGAETPAEIAVSIMAEVINEKHKNKKSNGGNL